MTDNNLELNPHAPENQSIHSLEPTQQDLNTEAGRESQLIKRNFIEFNPKKYKSHREIKNALDDVHKSIASKKPWFDLLRSYPQSTGFNQLGPFHPEGGGITELNRQIDQTVPALLTYLEAIDTMIDLGIDPTNELDKFADYYAVVKDLKDHILNGLNRNPGYSTQFDNVVAKYQVVQFKAGRITAKQAGDAIPTDFQQGQNWDRGIDQLSIVQCLVAVKNYTKAEELADKIRSNNPVYTANVDSKTVKEWSICLEVYIQAALGNQETAIKLYEQIDPHGFNYDLIRKQKDLAYRLGVAPPLHKIKFLQQEEDQHTAHVNEKRYQHLRWLAAQESRQQTNQENEEVRSFSDFSPLPRQFAYGPLDLKVNATHGINPVPDGIPLERAGLKAEDAQILAEAYIIARRYKDARRVIKSISGYDSPYSAKAELFLARSLYKDEKRKELARVKASLPRASENQPLNNLPVVSVASPQVEQAKVPPLLWEPSTEERELAELEAQELIRESLSENQNQE